MEERTKFHVGLDVHKDSISIGAAELGRAPAWLIGKVPHDLNKLLKGAGQDRHGRATAYRVRGWPDRIRTATRLEGEGLLCEIIAPSQIPRRPGDRVKTDGLTAYSWPSARAPDS